MSLVLNYRRCTIIHAIDFDGFLCEAKYPEIGKPYKDKIEFFKRCREKGHKVILWTCRAGSTLNDAIIWCKGWGLELDAVNEDVPEIRASEFGRTKSCKVYADVYWDDRNGSSLIADIIDQEHPNKDDGFKCKTCGLVDEAVEEKGVYHCPNPFCKGSGGNWFRKSLLSEGSTEFPTHGIRESVWTEKAFHYTHQLPVTLRVKILSLPAVKMLVKTHMKGKLS